MQYTKAVLDNVGVNIIDHKSIKIVICGYFGFNNTGDEAILSSMVNQIRSAYPGAIITVLSGDPAQTAATYGVEALDRADFERISKIVEDCNIVLLGGGGLFHEHYSIKISDLFIDPKGSMSYYIVISLIARLRNKPLIFFSHGIGPLFTTESREVVAFASKLANVISVRDNDSKRLLESMGTPENKIVLSFDPAINLVPAPDERVSDLLGAANIPPGKKIICVCPRGWIDKSTEANYINALTGAIDRLLEDGDNIILFVPFHTGPSIDDTEVCERIIGGLRKADSCRVLRGYHSPAEIAGVLSKARLVIGMRYHSIIFSFLSRVPFVALSYSSKVRSLARELGQEEYCLDIEEASADVLYDMVISALKNTDRISSSLGASIDIMKKRSDVSIRLIAQCLNGQLYQNDSADRKDLLSVSVGDLQSSIWYLKAQVNEKDARLQILDRALKETRLELDSWAAIIHQMDTWLQEKNKELLEKDKELKHLNARVDELSLKFESQESLLKDRQAEIDRLREVVRQRESSLSWRFSQYYGRYFRQSSIITRFLSFVLKKMLKDEHNNVSPAAQTANAGWFDGRSWIDQLKKYLDQNPNKDVCIVFSGTKFVENEGQRTLRLAQAFSRKGFAVIFAGWRWNEQEAMDIGFVYPDIFQIPIDMLVKHHAEILAYPRTGRKFLLIEFPHPSVFDILSLANSHGWTTIYDVLDDWESFNKVSQAVWYSKEFEEYVLNNSDVITAVSPHLLKKVVTERVEGISRVMPNAVSPEALGRKESGMKYRQIPRGAITIGYFGHLTPAWFDWDLVIATAKRNKDWKFHIIGYGKPDELEMPENVVFLGKVNPWELPGYASNWDVAIIPFKATELSKSVDPIKIYEYLYLELPVVVTGIYHLDKYPYVWTAHSPEEFEDDIAIASRVKIDKDIIDKFVLENTWDKRVEELINLASNARRNLKGA